MKSFKKIVALCISAVLVALPFIAFGSVQRIYAASNPSLGTAATYSIMAGSSVTNTGATTISGNVGISPGAGGSPNYTGFGSVTLGGVINDANGASLTAMSDRTAAYTALASQGCDTDYGGVTTELAGKTLVPGVYCSTSFHLSSGTLTLNGDSSSVWIFKSASDLVISGGASAKVIFTGGGQPCNVWWRVVSTASFDANSTLVGNILADTSITFAAGATLDGRALARTAEVTLSSNSITGPTCSTGAGSNASAGGIPGLAPAAKVCPPLTYTTPIIIEARRTTANSIFVSWGPYAGISTFNVRYGLTNGNWIYNTNVTGFSTTLNDLPSGQPFWIQVAATDFCSIGTYGTARLAGSPSLPNTGYAPVAWYSPEGLFIRVSTLLSSIQERFNFPPSL